MVQEGFYPSQVLQVIIFLDSIFEICDTDLSPYLHQLSIWTIRQKQTPLRNLHNLYLNALTVEPKVQLDPQRVPTRDGLVVFLSQNVFFNKCCVKSTRISSTYFFPAGTMPPISINTGISPSLIISIDTVDMIFFIALVHSRDSTLLIVFISFFNI